MNNEKKPRIQRSPEQITGYGRMMIDQGYSNKQIIELTGASSSTVVQWKHKYLAEHGRNIPPLESNDVPALQKRIALLEKELSRVKMEKTILKKAAELFEEYSDDT